MSSLLAILFAATSTSSSSSAVELRLDDCVSGKDLVHDLVAIELGGDPPLVSSGPRRVHVECRDQAVVIRIDPNPGGQLDRVVLRSDLASEGGPRLIALNIVELVQESEPKAASPVSPPLVKVIPPPPPTRFWIGVAPTLRFWSGPNGIAIGGLAKAGLDAPADAAWPWTFQLDGGFEQASANVSLGATRTRSLHGGISAGLSFDLGARLSWLAAIGARGGWSWIDGESANPMSIAAASGSGGWWGPFAALRIRFGRSAGLALGLEGGWTARPIYGRVPEGIVGARDGWLGLDLTIDWSPGT